MTPEMVRVHESAPYVPIVPTISYLPALAYVVLGGLMLGLLLGILSRVFAQPKL